MKDYLLYAVEDFVADESYLRYYFKQDEKDIQFWAEWIGLHPEKLDVIISANKYIDTFSIRLPEAEFQQEQNRFADSLDLFTLNDPFEVPNTIEYTYSEPPKIKWFRSPLFIAASIAVIAISSIWLIANEQNNQATTLAKVNNAAVYFIEKYVPKGEQARVILPDGTEVQLNSDSRLVYPSVFMGDVRDVQLSGEAFFNVKHDTLHPFHVYSGNLVTTVLGTSFNVRCYQFEKQVKVALINGKVRLGRLSDSVSKKVIGDAINLKPAEMGIFNKNSLALEKSKYDENKETGWRRGVIVFIDASFEEIANRIQTVYNLTLINKSVKKQFKFRGTFNNASAEEIVKSICLSKKLTYTAKGNTITIQ